jgi:hypothetical protein
MKTNPTLIWVLPKILWPSLLLLTIGTGCVIQTHHDSGSFRSSLAATSGPDLPEEDKLLLRYQIRDQESALESERVVLVFHGLSQEQRRLFHFQGPQQAVQIAGSGVFSVSTTCASGRQMITFRSDYAAGTNTLEFGARRVRLTLGGRLLLAGDEAVDLSEGRKIIHFKGDKISVE